MRVQRYQRADFVVMAALALLYGLLGKLVLSFFSETGNVTLVWFSGGLGLAVLLLKGLRFWPGIFVGAFAAGLMVDDDFWLSFVIATGNTLESLSAAWWLRRNARFSPALTYPGHFAWLTLTAVVCSLISALLGPLAIWQAGFIPAAVMPQAFLHWWMADVFGILFITPLLLIWREIPLGWFRLVRVPETIAFLGLTVVLNAVEFLDLFHDPARNLVRGYWLFAVMVWGAMRFGRHGAMWVSTVTAVTALLGTAQHKGFFARDFIETGMLNFWFYMTVLTSIGTTLSLTLNNNRLITQNLRESEHRLQTVLDTSPVPHAIYDEQGRATLLNPAFIKTFGYGKDDTPDLNSWAEKAYPDPAYRREVMENWQTLLARQVMTQQFETMEGLIRCKNGETREVLGGGIALQGSLQGSHLVILLDVTEQRQANRAVAESNQLLHTILETLPIRVFWKDRESRFLGCNTLFARDAGKSHADELFGMSDHDVGWSVNAEQYRRDDLDIMASGQARVAYEEPQTKANGETTWLRTSKLPLRNAKQQIIGILGVYEDITQRKQDEQQLAQSLSLLQATFEATGEGILVFDLQGNITACNQQFLQMWHLGNDSIVDPTQQHWVAMVSEQLADPEGFVERIHALNAQPELESFDLLAFRDGRLMERYSKPQKIAERVVGRVMSFRDITVRKRVEEQLLWRTAFLESLLESSPAGIVAVDKQGKKLLQNRRLVELWQIPAEIADNPDDSVQLEFVKNQTLEPQAFLDKVRALYKMPNAEIHDEIFLRRGLILDRFSKAVFDANGNYYGRIWHFTDVTEKRHAEQVLRQKEYYQRALLDNFPFMVWLKDAEGRYLAVNRSYLESRGVEAVKVIGKTDLEIFPQAWAEQYRAEDREVMDSGVRKNLEEELVEQGERKWFEVYKAPLFGDQGQILGTVGFSRDITDRKQAEEKLQLAVLVYQNSSEAMVVTDADNQILSVNPAFCAITGYAAEEVVGQDPRVLASGLHGEEFYKAMWHDVVTTGCWRGEIKNRRKSGEVYVEELTINTIFDAKGKPQRRVALFSDITARKQSEEQIWLQANFDPLTGLPNRRMFRDRLEQEIKKSQRFGQSLSLLFIDLDRFKEVNDTLGHEMGDILLRDAAKRLEGCIRDSDTVARLGGDEFTVILSELEHIASPERVATHILEKFSEPFRLNTELVYVSASIGITICPDDASDVRQLLQNADQAMYAAKNQGRNCYSFFTRSMQEALRTRAEIMADLRVALNEHQFELYFQPIVELATGTVRKAEALLRWHHPQRGTIGPAEFIGLAEETGLILEIGDWVFTAAVEQLQRWRQQLHPDFQISINKSPAQFRSAHAGAVAWQTHLQAMGLPGDSLVVEITEGLLLDASQAVGEHLLVFRDAGIQVAIDDFGTGYSALSYLKKFDIDFLKIDQSFVRNLQDSASSFVLCEAIIVMAHKLGLKVIAEGVETVGQRDLLASVACDYAQGYYYGKPVPADQFVQRFAGKTLD